MRENIGSGRLKCADGKNEPTAAVLENTEKCLKLLIDFPGRAIWDSG